MKLKKLGLIFMAVLAIAIMAIAVPALATGDNVVYVKDGGTGNGATPDTAMGDLFAAIDRLSDGGTVVVCGDLTVTGTSSTHIWTWGANSGKVTVSGKYNGIDYNPTITFKGTKNVIECASAIEFDNLTLDHCATGGSTEFYAGPSLTFGNNMTFLNDGAEITTSKNGFITVRLGNYNAACQDSRVEIFSGTLSYVQGANNKQPVTNSTIILHPGVKLTDHLQCSGTGQNVGTGNVTVDGADINVLYINGHGVAKVTESMTISVKNSNINQLLYNRSGSGTPTCAAVDLTLDNTTVGSLCNIDNSLVTGNANLTLKNYTDLTLTNTLSGWDSLTLNNATVWVDAAYAGPAAFTADSDSLLIVDDATATIPTGALKESAAVVTVDGTNVADLGAAYTALSAQGGIIRLATDITVALKSDTEFYAWPNYVYSGTAKTGPVTITSADPADPAVLTLQAKRTGRSVISVRQTTKFSNLELRAHKDSSGGIQIFAGPSLTFGNGLTCTTNNGAAITVADTLGIRLGDHNTDYANRDSKFYMYSGTVNFIQGGNDRAATKNSTIYVGKDATIVHVLQCGGTGKAVSSATVTVDGAAVNELYLNGHGAGATMGTVSLTVRNATVNSVKYHRTTDAAATCTTANLVLDNSTVGTIAARDSRITTGNITIKNYDYLTIGTELSGWNSVTLDNAIVYVNVEFTGNLAVVADADSKVLYDTITNPNGLSNVTGVATAVFGSNGESSATPLEKRAEVYLDQSKGLILGDGSADGSAAKPVSSLADAYAILQDGAATIHLVGEYKITGAPGIVVFPYHNGKVTIQGTDAAASINFDTTDKTLVQFSSATELKDLQWRFAHRDGNMDIYSGPELSVQEGVSFHCDGHGGIGDNCIAIRGGYQKAAYQNEAVTTNDVVITVNSGTLSYVMGGNGVADIAGNATINIGGTAVITTRVMSAGANGNSIKGDVTINITGGEIKSAGSGMGLVLIGHGTESKTCTVDGDVTVNITGGKVSQIVSNRTSYEKLKGDLNVTIGSNAQVGNISFDKAFVDETNGETEQNLIFGDNIGLMNFTGSFGNGWDTITIGENNEFYCYQEYSSTAALTVKAGSTLYLSNATNTAVPPYTSLGSGENAGKVVLIDTPDHLHIGDTWSGEKLTVLSAGGMQGTAVYGDWLFQAADGGGVSVYNLSNDNPGGTRVATFRLASYNAGTLPDGVTENDYLQPADFKNHANQMVFGATKFDENDPFPLLYVTTGNSGGHDHTGAYIAKCAVERIKYDETTNTWSAELVQMIEFNDMENIPDEIIGGVDVNPYKNQNLRKTTAASEFLTNMRDPETGKFYYISGNGYDASKGYQKIGWGWAASFVDSDPTAETAGKFYLYSARYRTYTACDGQNKTGYGNGYTNYAEENAYIITEFDMPALPTSEDDPNYGGTVTLYPKDITDQFETAYKIGGTQGGTMYQGKIYYPYGFSASNNGLQIFDIADKALTATYRLGTLVPGEPEGCAVWNGTVLMSDGNKNIWKFNMLMEDQLAKDATCTEAGTIDHAICNLCDQKFSLTDYKTVLSSVEDPAKPALDHSHTNYVSDGNATCTEDGTKTAICDRDGCTEPDTRTDAGSALGHSHTNYVSDGNATCTEDGTKTAICDRDGCNVPDTKEDAGSALGHSHTNYVSNNDATCTEDGTETAICDRDGCTEPDTRTDVDSKGHKFTNYVSDNNATCTEDGTKTAVCDHDGCSEKDTVADAGSKLGHKLTKVDGKEATCTEDGVVEHYTCSACEKNFSDAEGKTALTTTVIPSCHSVEKVEGKAATATENGQKAHYACASCGKTYADAEGKTEVTRDSLIISATNAPTDTGDDFQAWPFILLMVLSAAGVAVLVIGKKQWFRKKK